MLDIENSVLDSGGLSVDTAIDSISSFVLPDDDSVVVFGKDFNSKSKVSLSH